MHNEKQAQLAIEREEQEEAELKLHKVYKYDNFFIILYDQ